MHIRAILAASLMLAGLCTSASSQSVITDQGDAAAVAAARAASRGDAPLILAIRCKRHTTSHSQYRLIIMCSSRYRACVGKIRLVESYGGEVGRARSEQEIALDHLRCERNKAECLKRSPPVFETDCRPGETPG